MTSAAAVSGPNPYPRALSVIQRHPDKPIAVQITRTATLSSVPWTNCSATRRIWCGSGRLTLHVALVTNLDQQCWSGEDGGWIGRAAYADDGPEVGIWGRSDRHI
jgi:hypothetical protein